MATALNVAIQGQGVVSADNLNTYQQTCDSVAQLRGFIGIPGVQVAIRGTAVPNDGGQGTFYWNATGVAADDNGVTTVVPTAANASGGEWTRLTVGVAFTGLLKANNLSDVANVATSRTNLGLGSAAVAAATTFLNVSSNLSDLASLATALTNLGFGTTAQSFKIPNPANTAAPFLIKTGVNTISSGTSATFSFPLAFPNQLLSIVGCDIGASTVPMGISGTTTQYTVAIPSAVTKTFNWIAVGN